jgi:hypothetical protein
MADIRNYRLQCHNIPVNRSLEIVFFDIAGRCLDRARLVKWWVDQFAKTLLPEITSDEISAKLKPKRLQAAAIYNRYLACYPRLSILSPGSKRMMPYLSNTSRKTLTKKVRSQPLRSKIVRFVWCGGNETVIACWPNGMVKWRPSQLWRIRPISWRMVKRLQSMRVVFPTINRSAILGYLTVWEKKPGALRHGAPFQDWDLPPATLNKSFTNYSNKIRVTVLSWAVFC